MRQFSQRNDGTEFIRQVIGDLDVEQLTPPEIVHHQCDARHEDAWSVGVEHRRLLGDTDHRPCGQRNRRWIILSGIVRTAIAVWIRLGAVVGQIGRDRRTARGRRSGQKRLVVIDTLTGWTDIDAHPQGDGGRGTGRQGFGAREHPGIGHAIVARVDRGQPARDHGRTRDHDAGDAAKGRDKIIDQLHIRRHLGHAQIP